MGGIVSKGPKPVVAVAGATGQQGGGLVEAILQEGKYTVRALTRDPTSEKARALAARGCEVVAANVDEPATLVNAFTGCQAAFLVTQFWDHLDAAREMRQAKNLCDACLAAGVKHVVWSSLEDTRPAVGDKLEKVDGVFPVPHFDGKAVAAAAMRASGLPVTELITSIFNNNLTTSMAPRKGEDGVPTIALTVGDKATAWIAVEDIGRCAYAIIKQGPKKWAGKIVGIVGDVLTGEQIAAAFSEAAGGKPFRYVSLPDEVYLGALKGAGLPEAAAKDLTNMFAYYRECNASFLAHRDLAATKRLYPRIQSFRTWALNNKDAIAALA